MRWYRRSKLTKGVDYYRNYKFFAWLPVTLNFETRWLETVKVLQKHDGSWKNIKFVDELFETHD